MKWLILCLFFTTHLWAETLPLTKLQGQGLVSGQNYSWSFAQAKKATVVVFMSSSCPCSRSHETYFTNYKKQFPDIDVIGIIPKGEDESAEAKKHFQEAHLPFPVIEDSNYQYVKIFKALKTPHAYLINPKQEILFAGGPTDSSVASASKKQFLTDATNEFLQGKPILTAKTKTLGCRIDQE